MIQPAKPDLITVNIDGREIAVPKGTNMIEAARLVGVDVPHYCYHPKLSVVGNCRMCLIEMGLPVLDPGTRTPIVDPATGRPQINWIPRPQIGCATYAAPGLHIRTGTAQIKDCREGVMEFLLVNHPLDCPICDQAGECRLQEQATGYGRGYSRFIEQKNVKPKRTQLGPRVMLDDERCILCSRCIRFCKEIAQDDVLGFTDRGSYTTLTCFPGRMLANNYSLNTVDICPVGALTSTDFRFKMRVWFLKQTNSIDTESSVGANTVVWSREGAIYRITPRRNDQVNDTWLPDSARELFKVLRAPDRLAGPKVNGADADLDAAIQAAAALGRDGRGAIAVVGSGRSSVEEQFLTGKLATALGASVHLVTRVGLGDGLLISADRNPNVRGALVVGLISALPKPPGAAGGATPPSVSPNVFDGSAASVHQGGASVGIPGGTTAVSSAARTAAGPPIVTPPAPVQTGGLADLGAAIDAGSIKTVVSVGEDLAAAGLTAAQLARVAVVYLGLQANATSGSAKVVIPTLSVFEKDGTFVNQQFRLQKFSRAVPAPAGASDDLAVLAALVAASGGAKLPGEVRALWPFLAAEVPALACLSWPQVPDEGVLLDGSPWAALPFSEGETLHYKPAAVAAAGRPTQT